MTEGNNSQRVIDKIIRSEKALEAAQTLLEKKLYEDCVSRSYYSVLHASKAALLKIDIEIKSHKGVRSMFGLHLVKSGIIEKEFAAILTAEQEDRELGDYETGVLIEEERAKQRVKEAEKFLNRIKKYLEMLRI